MIRKIFLLSWICLLHLGCGPVDMPDSKLVPNHVVEVKEAKTADVFVRMFSGHLFIGPNAKTLMVGTYQYNNPTNAPTMNYTEIDQKGWLSLLQADIPTIGTFPRNDAMNRWDIQLNKDFPTELSIEFGKGDGKINLNDMNLTFFRLLNKKGKLDIDLSTSKLKEDLVLWMDNEAGEISIHLPKNVGVQVTTVRGAQIVAEGFKKEDAVYKNEWAGSDAKQIFVDIKSEAGTINVR
ncbi:MAG: hypothetical protein KBD53_07115 [Candidatus Omnitrophica bacterium]|nr:hypothetical protein [Candidatus Omnitrophota bacterium]